jgi:hypothetical protein
MASIINATTTNGLSTSADNSGSLQLATNNGTTAVTIDTSQNVGIGEATPAGSAGYTQLVVRGSSGAELSLKGGTTQYGYMYVDSGGFRIINPQSGASSGTMQFSTSNTERMRITSDGIVWVGASSGAWQGRLSIQSNSDTSYYPIAINNTAAGTGSFVIQDFYRNATRTGTITATGTATAYNTSSDYRLKEDVQPMTNALATVSALKPVTYKWKLDGSNGQGFIAHELAGIVPDAVSGEKDAVENYTDENGNEQTRIVPQGVDTSYLVATLTAALQELNAKVEAQAVRIAELEGAK